MPNLQLHQLTVASVAKQICESINIKVDNQSVITACLFHDMGNIIKFDLNYFPEFNKPEGLEYWQKVQKEYFEKYGMDEHHATVDIIKELNLSRYILDLVNVIDLNKINNHSNDLSLEEKIVVYVDNRVNPYGVVSLNERREDVNKRYKNHPNVVTEEENFKFVSHLETFEKEIFCHSDVKPKDITNFSVKGIIESLKNLEI